MTLAPSLRLPLPLLALLPLLCFTSSSTSAAVGKEAVAEERAASAAASPHRPRYDRPPPVPRPHYARRHSRADDERGRRPPLPPSSSYVHEDDDRRRHLYDTYPREREDDEVMVNANGETSPFRRSLHDDGEGEDSNSARLRRDLLANYDRASFPWETVWNATATPSGQRTGLDVEVGINFHRIYKVDVSTSLIDLIVWFRQRWHDPRLAWNSSDYGGLTMVNFWIGEGSGPGGEMSEIWTPDLELWNMESALKDSLTDAYGVVSHDGTVFWSRPGHLRPVCKFVGLDSFPFDQLTCTSEIGSWGYSGLYLRPTKFGGVGYSIGGSDTAGEAYAEYTLGSVECERVVYPPFPGAPEEDWPVLLYHVTFERAWQPYARGYLFLQVLLNFAGFACMWLPPHCGERMALAITALLAAVTSELVIAANLPAAAEMLWFNQFALISTTFASLAVFQSVLVIYLYYYKEDNLIPGWFIRGRQYVKQGRKRVSKWFHDRRQKKPTNATGDVVVGQEAATDRFQKKKDGTRSSEGEGSSSDDDFQENKLSPSSNSSRSMSRSDIAPANEAEDCVGRRKSSVTFAPGTNEDEDGAVRRRRRSSVTFAPGTNTGGDNMMKEEDDSLDSDEEGDEDDDLRSSLQKYRTQFYSGRTRKGIKAVLGRDADDYKNVQELENNYRWQKIAKSVDDLCRVIFPVVYVSLVAAKFAASDL